MKIEIKSRYSASVLFSLECGSLKIALEAAVKEGADLKGADLEGAYLEGADLEGAYLEGADLRGAYLEGADLRGADLSGADLSGADLEGADLKGADLEGADLEGADLEGAYLEGADLKGADLEGPKADFWKVLDAAPAEVPGLRAAMVEGKIDGSQYSGDCACLVGTIANVAKCDVNSIPGLKKNSDRPAEVWFLMFRPGHTPNNHGGMAVTLEWLDEWTEKNAKVAAK